MVGMAEAEGDPRACAGGGGLGGAMVPRNSPLVTSSSSSQLRTTDYKSVVNISDNVQFI